MRQEIVGAEALATVRQLHRRSDLSMDSAWVATYGRSKPSIMLYVGIAANHGEASRLVAAMDTAIRQQATPFRFAGQDTVEGGVARTFEGLGQLHYVFTDGARAVWLAADSAVARGALAQALGVSVDDEVLHAITPAGRPGSDDPLAVRGLGPLVRRLVEAGAIDTARLDTALTQMGHPLTRRQRDVLGGRNLALRLDTADAAFLLNALWPLGLVNRNAVLTQGPMAGTTGGRVMLFASTGGWKLSRAPVADLYASEALIPLNAVEQARLMRVSHAVYRPCCDNPTDFPDCNHGMAMLALLTLQTAQGADDDALFAAARAANAVWFPQQSRHVETVLATLGIDGDRPAVGRELFSGSGHRVLMVRLARQDPSYSASAGPAC